jgi:GLPGLI family protein
MACFKFTYTLLFIFVFAIAANAQITYGKITYERKTNLFKKYKDDNVKEWLDDDEKTKVDIFELYFNDTASVFKPQETGLKEKMSWATSRNTTYQNYKTQKKLAIKSVWGEGVYIEDTIATRQWKITGSKRKIAGYDCRKAIWQMNDSTRIYVWYTDAIISVAGPENFQGLPGAILGLATEDGGVIYFAKTVEIIKPNLDTVMPQKGKNKIYTPAELKTKLEKDFGKSPWGKALIKEIFSW